MEIRPLRAAEVPSLVDDLWFPFAGEMAALDDYDALADDRDVVRAEAVAYQRDRFEADDVETFVAVADDALRGYVTVSRSESPSVFARGPTAAVSDLYVAPDARGDGLGSALLSRAHDWGRDRGCERASLSVHVSNDAARALYESVDYDTRYLKLDRPL